MPLTPVIQSLSDSLISEIVKDFGLPNSRLTHSLFHPLFHRATDRLAALGLSFDLTVGEKGTCEAASDLLAQFCHPVETYGLEHIPVDGPTLIVSNHPGTFDSLVLLSQIKRADVRFISSSIPFVKALPHASRHFIIVTRDPYERMTGVRQAVRHLQRGGAVLVFGSGHIDPDPAVYDSAEALGHIQNWWPSAGFLLNKVPETRLVLSIISHVVSPFWVRHPITWLRSGDLDQRRLAEIGQLVQQLLSPERNFLTPCISFSSPYRVEELRLETGSRDLMPAIISEACGILDEHISLFNGPTIRRIYLESDGSELFTRI